MWGALIQGGLGAYQMYKSSQMEANRPTKQVSQEAKDTEAMYGQMVQGGVPGAKSEIENIQRGRANTLGQAQKYTSSSANLLSMVGQTAGQESRAMRQSEVTRQKNQLGLIDRYAQAKSNLAQEKEKAWQYNLAGKYEEDAQAKSAMSEGGLQNIYGGVQGVEASSVAGSDSTGKKKVKKSDTSNNFSIKAQKDPYYAG